MYNQHNSKTIFQNTAILKLTHPFFTINKFKYIYKFVEYVFNKRIIGGNILFTVSLLLYYVYIYIHF